MAKTAKFDDVKRPDKVAPSATARPIIVSNHPMITKDPMMAPAVDAKPKEDESSSGAVMTHASKTIAPLTPESEAPASTDEKKEETPEATKTDIPEVTTAALTPAPRPESAAAEPKAGTNESRDPDAAISAEETAATEAQAKRDQELEAIIASGTYVVPINAVQRRRSRIDTMFLCILAVVLAAILFDVVADTGVVHVPSNVPHTHFFSKN